MYASRTHEKESNPDATIPCQLNTEQLWGYYVTWQPRVLLIREVWCGYNQAVGNGVARLNLLTLPFQSLHVLS